MNTYTKTVLPNGIRLIQAPLKGSQTATILVLFGVGSRYELPQVRGISHFLEHMFFKGTKNRPTSLDITKELDSVGAYYNAFTGKEYTGYYVKVAHQQLDMAVDIVSDMLLNSLFDSAEIKKESGTILEEKKMYEENPIMFVDDVFEETMFRGNSLGEHIIGTKETIKETNREKIITYKNSHYVCKNCVIVVSGRFDDDIVGTIQNKFSELPDGEGHTVDYDKFVLRQDKPRVALVHKEVNQAQMGFGYPACPYDHADEFAMKLLRILLGGNMSSRLFTEVREKRGLAYMVNANLINFLDTGSLMIQAGLDVDKLDMAIEVIIKELEKIKNGDVTEKELQQSKNFYQGATSIMLEDTGSLCQWYGKREVLTGKVFKPREIFEQINKTSKDDLVRVANETFKKELVTLALIGPYKDSERFIKLLS